jgi:class 3 adenylate cyclase
VRSSQIGSHYDGMSADKRAAFDANAAKFLSVSYADRVIVSVTFHTDLENYAGTMRHYWASQSVAKLGTTTYLNAGAERLSLTGYNFQGDTFMLTFPRPKQLKPEDKVGIEFISPRISVIDEQRILQEFSVKKMTLDGQPVF